MEIRSRWRRAAQASSFVLVVASAVVLILAGVLVFFASLSFLFILLIDPLRGLPFLGFALMGVLLIVLGRRLLGWRSGDRS